MDIDIPTYPVLVLPKIIEIRTSVAKPDLWYTYECTVCNRYYHEGPWAYNNIYNHLRTKEHRERMELRQSNYCNTCELQFPTASKMAAHCETKRHKQKEAGTYSTKLHCDVCDRTFTCPSHYQYHIATKAHAKMANPPKRDCDICGIHVTTDKQMEAHLATKKHRRNVESRDAGSAPVPENGSMT